MRMRRMIGMLIGLVLALIATALEPAAQVGNCEYYRARYGEARSGYLLWGNSLIYSQQFYMEDIANGASQSTLNADIAQIEYDYAQIDFYADLMEGWVNGAAAEGCPPLAAG